MGKLPISVFVEFSEGSSKIGDLRFWDSWGDVCQGGLTEPSLVHILVHVGDHAWVELYKVIFFVPLTLDPWVLEGFLRGKSYVSGSL